MNKLNLSWSRARRVISYRRALRAANHYKKLVIVTNFRPHYEITNASSIITNLSANRHARIEYTHNTLRSGELVWRRQVICITRMCMSLCSHSLACEHKKRKKKTAHPWPRLWLHETLTAHSKNSQCVNAVEEWEANSRHMAQHLRILTYVYHCIHAHAYVFIHLWKSKQHRSNSQRWTVGNGERSSTKSSSKYSFRIFSNKL